MTDLRINDLSRYRKTSGRLILEEHSHCEVPAGCGGVVLRWRDRSEGLPVELWLHTAGDATLYLDGQRVTEGRPIVPYGPHLLAVCITREKSHPRILAKTQASGILMFAAVCTPDPGPRETAVTRIVSKADGTWKHVTKEPAAEQWTLPGFDDSSWAPMPAQALPQPGEKEHWSIERIRKLTELGATGLGAPKPSDRLWVRKTFVLTAEGLR